jgi:hypothetical protein
LKFDAQDRTDILGLKYVVVGRAYKSLETHEDAHYVLVVRQRLDGGDGTYERVGVGCMQRRHISFQGGEFEARII